jgi:hypothetical protein
MKRVLSAVVLVLAVSPVIAQTKFDAWKEFAKTKFEAKYNEKIGEYLFYPTFSDDIRALEGKEITIEGFYVPFAPEDGNYIIISKFPMSQCFFCGGGGPESIARHIQLVPARPDDSILTRDDLTSTHGMRHVRRTRQDLRPQRT